MIKSIQWFYQMAAKGFSWKYVPPNFRLWWGEGNHTSTTYMSDKRRTYMYDSKWFGLQNVYHTCILIHTDYLITFLRGLSNNRQLKTERTERTLALIEDKIALLKEVCILRLHYLGCYIFIIHPCTHLLFLNNTVFTLGSLTKNLKNQTHVSVNGG